MNEFKVGLLAFLAIASLVVVSLQITANKATFGEFVEYKTILDDATGIYENSSIKVAGIVAGKIKKVSLSGSQALITFEVLENIKITKFSRLRIKSVGFLGDKYIDIFLGNPDAPRLPAGEMVPSNAGSGFEQLGKDASEILKDVKVIAKTIRDSLYTDDQQNAIKQIVQQVNEFSHNANDISKTLKRVLDSNEGSINKTVENLQRVTEQLAYETDRYSDGSFMNDLENVGPILEKVDSAVTDMKVIIADMRAGKGTVGKLLRDEEVVDSVNQTLSGLNTIVNRVNNFKTDVMIYTGVNNIDGSKTELDVDLMPSPERFFRFGFVSGDGTTLRQVTTNTTVVDNESPTVTEDIEVDENPFRFNLQIGRRINRLTVRAGLIETTGGVGFDYLLPQYGIRNSFEAYDFREDIGLNLRYTFEFRLWNVMHAKIMGDDLGRSADKHIYTFSAGLKFSDEDLAALIGLAL